MRSFSIKSLALSLTLAATLAVSAPTLAAGRQNRDQPPDRTAIQRVVRTVLRLFGVPMDDEMVVPHP